LLGAVGGIEAIGCDERDKRTDGERATRRDFDQGAKGRLVCVVDHQEYVVCRIERQLIRTMGAARTYGADNGCEAS
jgi:hypothetical protein